MREQRETQREKKQEPNGRSKENRTYRAPVVTQYGDIVELTKSVGVGPSDGIIGSSDVT